MAEDAANLRRSVQTFMQTAFKAMLRTHGTSLPVRDARNRVTVDHQLLIDCGEKVGGGAVPPTLRRKALPLCTKLVEAFLNPVRMEGDADYLRNHVHPTAHGLKIPDPASESLKKYFPGVPGHPKRLASPATVVDCHGRILVWLVPNAFEKDQSELYDAAHCLEDWLDPPDDGSGSWRSHADHFGGYNDAKDVASGVMNFSPAWFQVGHEWSVTAKPYSSPIFRDHAYDSWRQGMRDTHLLLSGLLAVMHPHLADAAEALFDQVRHPGTENALSRWDLIFSAATMASSRKIVGRASKAALPTTSVTAKGTPSTLKLPKHGRGGTRMVKANPKKTHNAPAPSSDVHPSTSQPPPQTVDNDAFASDLPELDDVLVPDEPLDDQASIPDVEASQDDYGDFADLVNPLREQPAAAGGPTDDEWEDEVEFEVRDGDEASDGGEWTTEEVRFMGGNNPFHARRPLTTVVHTNGVHFIEVRYCKCLPQTPPDEQLLASGLYPASQLRPQTAFTLQVLDDGMLDKIICKTPTRNYFTKLRRHTTKAFPDLVSDRYRELLRGLRQWMWITQRMSSGSVYLHPPGTKIPEGAFAVECPTCPKPPINLPKDYKTDVNQWKYRPQASQDGNFKAEQVRYKADHSDDIRLSDGLGFMVGSEKYKAHLLETMKDLPEKSDCREHRAVNETHTHWISKPGSDKQTWTTRSHGQSMKHFAGDIKAFLVFYDVICQYFKKLKERLRAGTHLELDEQFVFEYALGQWHVHGHQRSCFSRFAPLFIPGAGWVDGEVIETLWSQLNEASGSLRAMGTAHRQETLDLLMSESNWRKLVAMPVTLLRKYEKAVVNVLESELLLAQLRGSELVMKNRSMWELQARYAQRMRGVDFRKSLDLMLCFDLAEEKADTRAHVLKRLVEKEAGQAVGQADWISEGIAIQEIQLGLIEESRKLGRSPTIEQETELLRKRNRLQTRINAFETQSQRHLGLDLDPTNVVSGCDDPVWDELDGDEVAGPQP
ncbi:hypothetical protein EIP91_010791, partial [Steccherinum ochraceum]